MLIAQEKLETNIAEYVLYMYQIEDVIRAYKFKIDLITEQFIVPQVPSDSIRKEYVKWYQDLIREMKIEGIEKQGHLNRIKEVYYELSFLHNTLLNISQDDKYISLFETASEHIEEFRKKSNLGNIHVIEVVFHALYMKMLLKLQKKEISAETENSFDTMRILLAYLSRAYHQMKSGDMDLLTPKKN